MGRNLPAGALNICQGRRPRSKTALCIIASFVFGMADLTVEVRDHDIVVTKPGTRLSVTYRKDRNSPLLVALDPMRGPAGRDKTDFLAQAWKAAYARAKALGWI